MKHTQSAPDILCIATSELVIHPLIKPVPEWSNDDPRFFKLIEDIRHRGIDQPILVDGEQRIVDGRHRWRAAKRLKLPSVPVVIVEGDVAQIALQSLIQRRHYTPGQRAYVAYPLFAEAHAELKAAHLTWLKSGGTGSYPAPPKTVEDLAREVGVSRDSFERAGTLHAAFLLDPDLRLEWEPKILDEVDPLSLGHCLAGIGGQKATKDQAKRPESSALVRWRQSFTALRSRLTAWETFDEESKAQAIEAVRQTVDAMPPELREALVRTLKAAQREAAVHAA